MAKGKGDRDSGDGSDGSGGDPRSRTEVTITHVRSQTSSSPVRHHGVLEDDIVAVAAAKLQRLDPGKGRVYIWTRVALSAHEAFGILSRRATDGDPPGLEGIPASLPDLLDGRNRAAALEALQACRSPLTEPVSVLFRYVKPGRYFAAAPVSPFDFRPPGAGSGADDAWSQAFTRQHSLLDFSNLLVNSFRGAGSARVDILFTTEADLAASAPRLAPVLFPPTHKPMGLYSLSPDIERRLLRHRQGDHALQPATAITYVRTYGAMPHGAPPMDVESKIVAFFSNEHTSAEVPFIRVKHSAVSRPVCKAHSSFDDASLALLQTPSAQLWLQVGLRVGGRIGVLLFPGNPVASSSPGYKFHAAFPARLGMDAHGISKVLPAVNAMLARISAFLPPVTPDALRECNRHFQSRGVFSSPRSLVDTTCVLTGNIRPPLRAIQAELAASAFPVMYASGNANDLIFAQYTRTSNVNVTALVQSVLYHNAALGKSVMMRKMATDFGIEPAEIARMGTSDPEFFSILPFVALRKLSDTRLEVRLRNGNSVDFAGLAAGVAASAVADARSGRAAPKLAAARRTAINSTPPSGTVRYGSELEDIMDIVEEERDAGDSLNALNELEYQEEDAAAAAAAAADGVGLDAVDVAAETEKERSGDILHRLKTVEPDIFNYPTDKKPFDEPYSRKCQKGVQPVLLTDKQIRSARDDANPALGDVVRYGSDRARTFGYACPEKWCVTSAVARRHNEACPDPSEPSWSIQKGMFPGFKPATQHPGGLCMPCCFKKRPQKGNAVYERTRECYMDDEEGAAKGDGADQDQDKDRDAAGPEGAANKTYINRSGRKLSRGAYGQLPGGIGLPANAVRVGLGVDTDLVDAAALTYGFEGRAGVVRALLKHTSLPVFMSSTLARAYISASRELRGDDANAKAKAPAADIRADDWEQYRRLFSLPADAKRSARDTTVLTAYSDFRRHAAAFADVPDGDDRWRDALASFLSATPQLLMLNNGGAGELPPMLLVAASEAGCFAEFAPALRPDAAATAVTVVGDGSVFEPVVLLKDNNRSYDAVWDLRQAGNKAAAAWVAGVRHQISGFAPGFAAPKYRVVGYALRALGEVGPRGEFLPFWTTVPVSPGVPHRFVSDGALKDATPATKSVVDAALHPFRGRPPFDSAFYKDIKRLHSVASTVAREDAVDALIFQDPSVSDTRVNITDRVRVLDDLRSRVRQEVLRLAEADGLDLRSDPDAAAAALKKSHAARLNKAFPDAAAVVEHMIQDVVRPGPHRGHPPVSLEDDERVVAI